MIILKNIITIFPPYIHFSVLHFCEGRLKTCDFKLMDEKTPDLTCVNIKKTLKSSVEVFRVIGSVLGNRTPDSAVRGLRLNLLTNTPYLIARSTQDLLYRLSALLSSTFFDFF